MMVYSFKLNRKILLFVLIGLIALITVLLIATSGGGAKTPADISNDAATPEQRLAFIAQFGWEVEPEPVETLSVYIPSDFDAVLQRYNAIQQAQGYDLTNHRGLKVTRYSYAITNYPGYDSDVFINLLVSEGKVIGGDICSKQLGGFIHGFDPKRIDVSSAAQSVIAESEAVSASTEPEGETQSASAEPENDASQVLGVEVSGPTD